MNMKKTIQQNGSIQSLLALILIVMLLSSSLEKYN